MSLKRRFQAALSLNHVPSRMRRFRNIAEIRGEAGTVNGQIRFRTSLAANRTRSADIHNVIICSRGVFLVETKMRKKPTRRGSVISVTADELKVDGSKSDRDPMKQARAAALDIHQILKSFTPNPIWVNPIVVFPGWSIADSRESHSLPWVLNAEDLAPRIAKEPEWLSALTVARLSRYLARYIRSSQ
jgi:hypothetical protein